MSDCLNPTQFLNQVSLIYWQANNEVINRIIRSRSWLFFTNSCSMTLFSQQSENGFFYIETLISVGVQKLSNLSLQEHKNENIQSIFCYLFSPQAKSIIKSFCFTVLEISNYFMSIFHSYYIIMTSIDIRDAEVQHHFTALRRALTEGERVEEVSEIIKMYDRSDEYSYGIFARIIKFISESNEKEDKRIGLMVLSALGEKMEGTARSNFVNKFHSPVFKLMEENLEEILIPFIERSYEIILEIGGNRNDSAVQSNLASCFAILESTNSKDVKKMGAYAILRILVTTSPYITFKKLLQKQKNSNLDNLSLAIASAKVKNLKVRMAYFQFLIQYVKYIAEKKDHTFQKATFERFYENYSHITVKETNQEINHLYIETVNVFLIYLNHTIPVDRLRMILQYTLEKIQISKSPLIQKSLILLIPKLIMKRPSDEVISNFLRYLRSIDGQLKTLSQNAINEIIENISQKKEDILSEIVSKFKSITKKDQNYDQIISLALVQIKTIDILIKKFDNKCEMLLSKENLEQIVSFAMLIRLDQQMIKLIAFITKNNIHNLERILEIKLIITISKILTGSTRKLLRDPNQQFRNFIEILEMKEMEQFLDNQENKVKAIEALSAYRFREEFRQVVGGFVKDRILKYYLQWGNSKMKIASVQTAFFLYAKKGKNIAFNQLLQVLDKLLRVGLTDSDEKVREKVFMSIAKNFKRHEQFLHFFMNIELLSYLFQAIEDRNESIRLWALRIVCILFNKNPSVLITPYLKQYTYNCFYHLSSNFKYYKNKSFLIKSIIIIIELAPSVIENQVDSLLKLLLNYLSDRDNYEGLELLFFELIRALAMVLPDSLVPYAQLFSKHLVEAMKDKLNTKTRLVALKTFINIIKHCGYVVTPYFQINSLKQTLAYLIRSEIEEESRTDIMRIIGALGAVDNLRYSMIMNGCGPNKSPENLIKSLQKWGSKSNFLMLRERLIEQRQNNAIEKQLKLYYDELILLQNNKQLILMNKQQERAEKNHEKEINSPLKLQIEIDSSINFHMIILRSLFQILNDKSLSEKHNLTLDILNQMFAGMGSELQKQISRIMMILLKLVRSNEDMLNSIFLLGEKCDISEFVGDIVLFVIKQCKNIQLTIKVLKLLTAKYKLSLRHLIESIIDKLHFIIENYNNENLMIEISFIYQNIINYLEPYLSIIVPQIMDKFFRKNSETTNAFIDFIMNITKTSPSILQYMPIISYHFSHLLNLCSFKHVLCKPCLRNKLCNCIVLFIVTFKRQFISYLPMIHKAILKDEQMNVLYFKSIRYLENCSYGNISSIFTLEELAKITPEIHSSYTQKFQNPKYLKRVQGVQEVIHEFDPLGKKIIDEDWIQWLKKISILLLKKSPNQLLRGCSVLAEEYNELGLQLYNISFLHFWQILVDEQKKILIDNIKRILTYNPKPFLLVRKTFLSLAQFMNRKKCSFELSSSLLADCAGESSSFAKQLYYKELEFEANPEKTIESLIDTYMKLGEPQNAYGLFNIAQSLDIKCKIQWYQKIGKFEEAYKSYRQIKDERLSMEKIKCLSHLSDEKFINQFEKLTKVNYEVLNHQMSILAVQAYAHLQEWDKCEKVLEKVQKESTSKQFWTSILEVKKGKYKQALTHLNNTRQLLYESIPDLINFSSTSQGFEKFITMQQLFELQQIVILKEKQIKINESVKDLDENEKIKLIKSFNESSQKLRSIWSDRLIGCSKNSNTYKNLSIVRSLLFNKSEYFQFYYELCEIYIREKNIGKCEQLIQEIKAELKKSNSQQKQKLLHLLEIKINFTDNLIKQLEPILKIQSFLQQHTHLQPQKIGELYYLSALALYDNHPEGEVNQTKILELLQKSANLCNSQKEWYIFSIMNLQFSEQTNKSEVSQKYIQNALISLINSLKLTTNQNDFYLQGYLKLLSLLCNYSKIKRIYDIFSQEYRKIPVEGWINVVPQMIAQLFQPNEQTNFIKLLKMLLKNIGSQHPQSVLFSLNFAAKSKISERTRPANEIISYIKVNHQELANEVEKISNELGRAAIKLKEYWYDGIESAWAIYNQNKNGAQIVHLLKELCQNVLNRNESNSEIAFHQEFGQDIRDGYNWLMRFQKTQEPICIAQVFETFYAIYKKVKDSFENIKKIYLKNVAPFLVTSKKYKSTIPGLYLPGKQCVKITGFSNELIILQSKQRPRKLTILGSDGKQYNFLLKGRQDLRLDERVMQFFSLVNKLLAVERQNLKRDLQITRYSIIPLTVNTGLIGWVENCDTLNQLIKEYRTLNKIRVYVEKQLYQKMSSDYAYLPVINKLEIFKNGLESTQGKDLQKILCLKSPNSEVWVQKRNNYTCSLATMSMVGYILGLGDRHPSNIMLQRDSGKIVHIDFGDCFEVAVLREKFPEKVPFRLTRMLQKAMGIPGIHGLFRVTCQMVMKILRENKESLFGVLQTFAQDPIISWRLTNEKKEVNEKNNFEIKKNIQDQIIGSIMQELQMQINESKAQIKQGQTQIIEQSPRRERESEEKMQQINEKAINALQRVKQKLRGTDFQENKQLTVELQVSKLIKEATSAINICQSWPGWCPFW